MEGDGCCWVMSHLGISSFRFQAKSKSRLLYFVAVYGAVAFGGKRISLSMTLFWGVAIQREDVGFSASTFSM